MKQNQNMNGWIMNEKLYLSVYVFSCKLMGDTMIAAIDHKHASSCQFLTFSSVAEKNWPFSWGYFGSWGHAWREVAIPFLVI